jgi:hypothetical protein
MVPRRFIDANLWVLFNPFSLAFFWDVETITQVVYRVLTNRK